jgi:CspA family cold shock protein
VELVLVPVFGKVKWFDGKKGFGFIESEDGSGDVFVHYADIEGEGYKTLRQGDRVQFELENTPKGKKAVKVSKAL